MLKESISNLVTSDQDTSSRPSTVISSSTSDPLPVFRLCHKLRTCIPECSALSDQELLAVFSQVNPKTNHGKQKILAFTFQSLGIPSVKALLETRKQEKKAEIRNNVHEAERMIREKVFDEVFAKSVVKELDNLDLKVKDAPVSILQKKNLYLQILDHLLSRVPSQKSSTPSSAKKVTLKKPITAKQPPSRQSSTQKTLSSTSKSNVIDGSSFSRLTRIADGGLSASCPPSADLEERYLHQKSQLEAALKEVQVLHEENISLRAKLDEITALFEESSKEIAPFDKVLDKNSEWSELDQKLSRRKTFLLQCQNAQLKRQLNYMQDDVLSRELFVHDVKSEVIHVKECLQEEQERSTGESSTSERSNTYSARNVKSSSKPSAPIQNSSPILQECIRRLDALQKNVTRQTRSRLDTKHERYTPFVQFTSNFLSPDLSKPLPLSKTYDGSVDHLNIACVSQLEICLSELLKDLVRIRDTLSQEQVRVAKDMDSADYIESCRETLVRSIDALMSISMHTTAAPIPSLAKPKSTRSWRKT